MTKLDLHIRRKTHGANVVLENLRLQVEENEVVSLVGASGCGKSTLLRLIAGLDDKYDGDIRLADSTAQDRASEIGFVFQEPRLFPWLSVLDNVSFGTSRQPRDLDRARSLLDEVGLAGRHDALPKQLSGGQAQRVAIARGLYRRPALLLMDEPFSAVDAFTRIKLQDMLMDIVGRHHLTVVLVTHDLEEAVLLADRVHVFGARPGPFLHTERIAQPRPRSRVSPELAAARNRLFDVLRGVHAI